MDISKKIPSKIMVVDGHYVALTGTVVTLRQKYSNTKILSVQTSQEAQEKIYSDSQYDLIILEISIPENVDSVTKITTGIQFLEKLMKKYSTTNIVVQSAYTKSLIHVKSMIENHKGGFTVVDKRFSSAEELLQNIDWSLQGIVHLPHELRFTYDVDLRWLNLLKFAFEEGLQDQEIARRMNITERTVRNYWSKIQDILNVYPNEKQNLRISTEIRARQEGLIE